MPRLSSLNFTYVLKDEGALDLVGEVLVQSLVTALAHGCGQGIVACDRLGQLLQSSFASEPHVLR